MQKVKVKLEVDITIVVDEGVEIGEIVSELEYEFSDTTTKADILDTEITDYEIE